MSEDLGQIKEQVRQFVMEAARSKGASEVNDEESLFKAGIIDSLGVFRLISFLEETFPVTVDDQDMVPENFQSVNCIEGFLLGKMGGKAENAIPSAPVSMPAVS